MRLYAHPWLLGAILSLLFIASVSIAADFRLIPTQVRGIPYFDKIGHFVLYGIATFFLHLALKPRAVRVHRMAVPLALLLICALALLDEGQQAFSPFRAVDATDLAADWLGAFGGLLLATWFVPAALVKIRTNYPPK